MLSSDYFFFSNKEIMYVVTEKEKILGVYTSVVDAVQRKNKDENIRVFKCVANTEKVEELGFFVDKDYHNPLETNLVNKNHID
jgi:hypothetical protein